MVSRGRTTGFWVALTGFALLASLGPLSFAEGPTPASAQYGGGTPINVNAFGCINALGGQRSVPAGSSITIRFGWASGAVGGVHNFLNAQLTSVSVNDRVMVDVSGSYSAPAPHPLGWATFIHYPTGVTLHAAGDSMRFTFVTHLTRKVTDPSDYDGDGTLDPTPYPRGLLVGGTCTVTARAA